MSTNSFNLFSYAYVSHNSSLLSVDTLRNVTVVPSALAELIYDFSVLMSTVWRAFTYQNRPYEVNIRVGHILAAYLMRNSRTAIWWCLLIVCIYIYVIPKRLQCCSQTFVSYAGQLFVRPNSANTRAMLEVCERAGSRAQVVLNTHVCVFCIVDII